MDIAGAIGKSLVGNKQHIIENWKKGLPYYIVAEILAELSPAITWKT